MRKVPENFSDYAYKALGKLGLDTSGVCFTASYDNEVKFVSVSVQL